MLRSFIVLLVISDVVCCFQACGNRESRIIPVEDFFSSSEKRSFQLSPGGGYVAYLGLYEGRQNIYIIHLDEGNSEVRVTTETEQCIRSYFWADDDELIVIKDMGVDDNLRVFAVNRNTQAVRLLM